MHFYVIFSFFTNSVVGNIHLYRNPTFVLNARNWFLHFFKLPKCQKPFRIFSEQSEKCNFCSRQIAMLLYQCAVLSCFGTHTVYFALVSKKSLWQSQSFLWYSIGARSNVILGTSSNALPVFLGTPRLFSGSSVYYIYSATSLINIMWIDDYRFHKNRTATR